MLITKLQIEEKMEKYQIYDGKLFEDRTWCAPPKHIRNLKIKLLF